MTPMAGCWPETRPFQTWDVFTTTRFGGNPLAIVDEADGLTVAQMQVLAREFNLSETIFVQSPEDPAHDAKVRIFFPTAEIPFAGHPTIGCALYLALKSAPEGDFATEITLEEQAGLVPVRVRREAEALRAEFVAPVLPHAPKSGAVAETGRIAAALGLSPEAIGFAGHAPGLYQGGPGYLYVPVADPEALAAARPHEPAWTEVMTRAATGGAYLYTPGGDCDYRARMFAPGGGVPEDPATGSASAILAAQLSASGALSDGTNTLSLRQGVEMGRPSEIGLTIDVENGAIAEIRVSGSAVAISEGRVALPPR